MRIVAFATIKLNSQRVPHKNLQMVGSRPLCWHIVNTALGVKAIDSVYVYCSDEKVIDALPEGAKFLKRDKRLDGDKIRAKETYNAFLKDVEADLYIALCTTSPFMRAGTLANALDHVLHRGYDSSFSARRMQTFAWHDGCPLNYDPADVPRTQDIKPVFVETSAFFIFSRELWKKHGRRIGFNPYIQEVDEIEGIDIDEPEDLEFARIIAEKVLKV